MKAGLDTTGKRLEWAISQRPARGRRRGTRLFQRDIEARSREREEQGKGPIPGVTLPSIVSYIKDRTDPSSGFMREAADLLGVRASWLHYGDGFPTEEEARAASIADAVPLHEKAMEFVRAVYDQLGLPHDYPDHVPHWAPPLAYLWAHTGIQPDRLVEAIDSTLEAIGVNDSHMTEEGLGEFILAMIPALTAGARLAGLAEGALESLLRDDR